MDPGAVGHLALQGVDEMVMVRVDGEVIMDEEIISHYWLSDLCNYESPGKFLKDFSLEV